MTRTFLDTSVLLGGLIELCRAKVVITDNARHFSDLVRHGVRVATSTAFAAELSRKS